MPESDEREACRRIVELCAGGENLTDVAKALKRSTRHAELITEDLRKATGWHLNREARLHEIETEKLYNTAAADGPVAYVDMGNAGSMWCSILECAKVTTWR